jgi:cysteine desulfurase
VLVSVILVNNEIGIIQPLAEVAKIVAEERRRRQSAGNKLPLYLHTDAAQAANYLDLHASRLGVDLMSLNGSKSYGPKQSGLLYIKAGTLIQPLIAGGGQEFNLRSGTENVAAIHGFTKALELAQAARHEESNRLSGLRKNLEEQIKADFPQATINGSPNHRAPHITSVTFDSVDNERLVMQLDERGIMCAVGSACSASSEEPSPVLRAIGLSERQARGTLRLSLGAGIGQPEIDKVVAVLRDLLINR